MFGVILVYTIGTSLYSNVQTWAKFVQIQIWTRLSDFFVQIFFWYLAAPDKNRIDEPTCGELRTTCKHSALVSKGEVDSEFFRALNFSPQNALGDGPAADSRELDFFLRIYR